MDWKECVNKRIVKGAKEDKNKIRSLKAIAEQKINSSDMLPEDQQYSKITLLYDALRELLECTSLKEGYRVYNHECYTAFLKEMMNLSSEADKFDRIRKIRNGINYYGKEISLEESKSIIKDIKELIKQI